LTLSYAACLGITALSMLLTYSKGARYAGAVVLMGLSLLPRRWWITAATVLLLGGGLAYSSLYGSERLQVTGDSSSARLSIWRSASAMLADHPLTGVGLDQFFVHFKDYIEPELQNDEAEKNTSHPHNLVLDLLLRVGPFGAFVFAGLIWRTARRGWQLWRAPLSERWLALAILAGGAAGLIHGLVDQGYFSTDLAIISWMFIGIIDALWLGWHPKTLAGPADSAA
jgi:putative inorganic carbon (hco3(-)) transporter